MCSAIDVFLELNRVGPRLLGSLSCSLTSRNSIEPRLPQRIIVRGRSTMATTATHSHTILSSADQIIQGFLRKRGFPVFDPTHNAAWSSPSKRSRTTVLAKKSVTFSEGRPRVHVVKYTEDDYENSWYNQSDYRHFSDECKRVLKETDAVVGEVHKIDDSLFCVRGLEDQIIPSVSLMKRKRKRALIKMIIEQHKIQRTRPRMPTDSEHIRDISALFSSRSRSWARELGLLDANR